MAQRETGIYRLLGSPAVYSAVQKLIGGADGRAVVVQDFIKPEPGQRILDIGCGPATMLGYLDGVHYTGLDFNPSYIEEAKARYGARGTFLVQSVDELASGGGDVYDTVLAIALLHHLSDAQSLSLFRSARACLHKGGRLITLDCAWTTPQNPVARLLIKMDRGKNVRTLEAYERLAREVFPSVQSVVRTDLNRFPYTHCIMTCQN
jgi:cyclopropane fatty-acyl-phospholipid synthase-like methyltransferase